MKTIRAKMTVLMANLCLVILVLVWVLTFTLLEPTYYQMIDKQLVEVIDAIEPVLPSADMIDEIDINVLERLKKDSICLDISPFIEVEQDSTEHIYYEGIGDSCAIHHEGIVNYFGSERVDVNTETALLLRTRVHNEGSLSLVIDNTVGGRQYVVGRYVPETGMIIIVSMNLERVEQALAVFKEQLAVVTTMVVIASVTMAAVASKWFTAPITKLSEAVKSVSGGNYEVSVPVNSEDEMGNLAQEFNAMAKEVNKADKLQKELVANFSHDLRTPLTLIKGYAEAVRDLTGEDEKLRNAQMNIIINETDRLTNLVSSAMEFSKYSSGVVERNLESFDVNELVKDIATRYNQVYESTEYKVETECCEDAVIYADASMIFRVIDNLLANAVSHIGIDKKIIIHTIKTDEGVKIEVEDHGDGIAEEEIPYIFDRYYRTRNSEQVEGTGLGLSIVKAILDDHEFPFGVESTLGKGSKFWFIAK